MTFMWIIVVLVVFLLAYVRLAPINGAAVNGAVEAGEDADGEGHCIRVVQSDAGALARVDAAAMALPRTVRVAGSVDEGRISYVTRSKWIGFPDYTTVQQDGDVIKMFARLRFGRSDFGVNRARLKGLVKAAQG